VRRPYVAHVGAAKERADRAVHRDRVTDRCDGADRVGAVGLRIIDAAHPRLRGAALLFVEPFAVSLLQVEHGASDRLAVEAAHSSMKQGMPGAPFRHVAAMGDFGWPAMWNGPSTVLGVAPATRRLLMSSTSMLTPITSEARMNSWRLSSHLCPIAVRNSIALNHSAPVGRTSLTKDRIHHAVPLGQQPVHMGHCDDLPPQNLGRRPGPRADPGRMG